MAFVSCDPKNILNPETAENCFVANPKELAAGSQFIGYYKHSYIEHEYNNKCYVLKGKDDGKDYLFYGATSLHNGMAKCVYGQLLCITYHGMKKNEGGKYIGKSSHIWKVGMDPGWEPSVEFVMQLQQEVMNRRIEVQNLLRAQHQSNHQMQGYPASQQYQQGGYAQPTHMVQPQYQYQAPNPNPPIHYTTNNIPMAQPVSPPLPNTHLNTFVPKITDPFG
jgi:hypothetical protein